MWTQLPTPTQFLAHVYCGQMVGWIKTPLGTEVDLGPGHNVLDGVPVPAKGAQQPSLFLAHVYCGHGRPYQLLLSSCWNCPWIQRPIPMALYTARYTARVQDSLSTVLLCHRSRFFRHISNRNGALYSLRHRMGVIDWAYHVTYNMTRRWQDFPGIHLHLN